MSPIYRSWLSSLALAITLVVARGGEAGVGVASRTNVDFGSNTCEDNDASCNALAVEEDSCVDDHFKCPMWAKAGDCKENPKYMLKFCQQSCGVCSERSGNVTTLDEINLGETQRIDSKRAEEVHARIAAAKEYLATVVAKDPEISPFLEHCQLTHQDCAYWAVLGECEANPGYMKTKCAPVCGTCDQLDIKKRCPIDLETMPNTWEPGDVNEFFTNLTTLEKFQKYEPRILARPDYPTGDSEETADYMVNAPWVVVLENFLSQDEAERLIELGMEEGYERSSDVGEIKYDGSHEHNVNNGRTSYNSWCSGVCYNDTVVKGVIDRITDLTNIPEVNSEWLQMLRYEEGEYYRSHHDYIEHQIDRQDGVRILTVYLYLNDLDEEEGGGTQFTNLGGLTVQPKRGRALLWPSVLDEDPHMKDRRTMHQALPVTKGSGAVKYGANAWIHQRDFKTAHKNGCA